MAEKLLIKNDRSFLVKDNSKDMHTQFGFISSKDLKKKAGSVVKTNKDVEMVIINPGFLDKLKKIKRGAQIIPLKDIGTIIALTGINKESIVIDTGSGSGYMAFCLAHIAKKVYTYEIREDHFEIVKKNIDYMGMKNITIKNQDFNQGIEIKNADLVNLDLPEPWDAIESANNALKIGGYIVSYSPTIPQVMDFVEKIRHDNNFLFMKSIEIIEREWEIIGRKVRPKTQQLGHSGFLTFARKVK